MPPALASDVVTDDEEVRDMPGHATSRGETQLERLREDIRHADEVQRQQQPLLSQAFKAVMATSTDHELQTRPMPLPGTPTEPTNRNTTNRWAHRHIPDRHRDLVRPDMKRGRPAPSPIRTEPQPRPQRLRVLAEHGQIVQHALVRHDGAPGPVIASCHIDIDTSRYLSEPAPPDNALIIRRVAYPTAS